VITDDLRDAFVVCGDNDFIEPRRRADSVENQEDQRDAADVRERFSRKTRASVPGGYDGER